MGYLLTFQDEESLVIIDTRDKKEQQLKAVDMFSLNGDFIKSFVSIAGAEKETGIGHIGECASGKRQTAGGYIWRFAKGEI